MAQTGLWRLAVVSGATPHKKRRRMSDPCPDTILGSSRDHPASRQNPSVSAPISASYILFRSTAFCLLLHGDSTRQQRGGKQEAYFPHPMSPLLGGPGHT